MANQVQYRIGFSADTSAVKSSLRELETSLKKISTIHLDSFMDDASLESAAKAAQDLQAHLHKAVNADTGKLNLSAFNASLQKSNQSVTSLTNDLLNAGNAGSQAFMQLARSIAAAEVPIKKVNSTLASIGQTLKNTVKWELSSSFVHGIEGAFSNALGYVKNLNTSLTNIRIVTGASVEEMARFAEQANIAAKALSTTTKAYADASLIYYQQGDSAEQAAKKAAITIKAANASFNTSAAEMSEYLTAVWNSYQVGANELERYVDIMAALGAKTATSLEEIATSMQKVAATANTVGVSMEQVSSIISTVSSVTRESAESIGTSYKTIFARIGDLKLGGKTEDGIGLGQVSSQLESIGVRVLDAQGNLRDMGLIIEDLGSKWQTMSEAQKTATAQVVAGKRQYTQLMALFENWDMYKSNMSIAENADGSLQEMADVYAESWEAASSRVTAAMESIYSSLLNDQAMIKFMNVVEKIVEGFGGLLKGLGGFPGILLTIGGALTTSFAPEIVSRVTELGVKIKDMFTGGNSEQAKFLATNAKMREELASLAKDSAVLGSGNQTELTGLINISEAKDKLIQSSKNLSQAQVAEIESAMSGYQQEIERIAQLQQAMDDLEADRTKAQADLQKAILQEDIAAAAPRKTKGKNREGAVAYKERVFNEANKKTLTDAWDLKIEPEFDEKGLQEFAKSSKKTAEQVKTEFSTVGGVLNSIFETAPTSVSELLSQSENFVTSITNATNLGKYLNTVFASTNSALNNSSASTEDIKNDLQASVTQAQALAKSLGGAFSSDTTALMQEVSAPGFNLDTEEGKAKVKELATLLETELNKMVQMAGPKAAALKAALNKIVPPEAKSQFEALWKSWEKGSITMQELQQKAEKLGINFKKAIKEMTEGAETVPQKLAKIGGGLMSLVGAINSFTGAWDTLNNPDATGLEKVTAIISAVGIAINLMNNSLVTSVAGWIAEAAAAAVAGGATGVAGWIASTAWAPLLLAVLAIAAAFLTLFAIVKGIQGIINYFNRFNKQLEDTKKAMEQNDAAIKKLSTDMQKLSDVMSDTSLTYDEQLSKINEITSAYGVQASMLEVLSGDYASLEERMRMAAIGQAGLHVENANANWTSTSDALSGNEAQDELVHDVGTTAIGAILGGLLGFLVGGPVGAAIGAAAGGAIGGAASFGTADVHTVSTYNNNLTDSQEQSLINQQAVVDRYGLDSAFVEDGIGVMRTEDLQLIPRNEWESLRSEEAKALQALAPQLEQLGYELDATGQIVAKAGLSDEEIDEAGLLKLLTNDDRLNSLGLDSSSYTGGLITSLRSDGYGQLLDAERQREEADLMHRLYGSDQFDLFQVGDEENYSVEDIASLIDSVVGPDGSYEDKMFVAKELSGYEHYADAAKYMAAGSIAESAVNNWGYDGSQVMIDNINATIPEGGIQLTTQDDLTAYVHDWLMDQLDEENGVTIDVLMKISPSDIIWGPNGEMTFKAGVLELAKAEDAVDQAQSRQTKIKEATNTASKETFSKDDYATLWASGLFETDEELRAFMAQSASVREAQWNSMMEIAIAEEEDALQDAIRLNEERQTALEGEIAAWMESNMTVDQLSEAVVADLREAGIDFESLSGEELYQVIYNQKARDEAKLSSINAVRSAYGTGEEEDATKQQQIMANFNALGLRDENGDILRVTEWSQMADMMQYINSEASTLTGNITSYNEAIGEGTALLTEQSQLMASEAEARGDLQAAEWWRTVGADIEKATKSVNAYREAIGSLGTLDIDALAQLSVLDKDALTNYQTMSSSEWDQYAYEQAMIYYDELAALYEKDSVDYIAVMQQKEATTREYYNSIREQQEAAAQAILNQWEEEKQLVENAIGSLQELLSGTDLNEMNFEAIEKLRQDLLAVGYTAEEVDAILRNLGKEETDEASIIEAAKLKTNLLLKNMGNATEANSAIGELVGDSAVTLTLDTDIDHTGLAADGEGGYSATLTTNPADGTKTLTLKTDTTKVKGVKDNGNGTYTVTYSLNGAADKTLTLSDSVTLTDLHKNDKDEVVVSYSVNGGETHTLTLGENFGLSSLKMGVGNTVIVSYLTPFGDERTLTLGENFQLTKMKMVGNAVIISYLTPFGDARELSLSENVTLDELSMDKNNNIIVKYRTPNGVSRTMYLSDNVTLSKLHINETTGDVEVGYTLPDGNTQTFNLTGGATIDKAEYNTTSKTWTIKTSNGETIKFNGKLEGTGWSIQNGKYVYTTEGGMTITTDIVPDGEDSLPEDGDERHVTVKVNYTQDLGKNIEVREMLTAAWDGPGKQAFEAEAASVNKRFSDMTRSIMEDYDGDIAAYVTYSGKSQQEVAKNIATIGEEVDRQWQEFLAKHNGDVEAAWGEASQNQGFMYGYNLYTGLMQGYESAYGNYTDVIGKTSTSLLNRIRISLGESSPSKYTREMGRFLMIGLQQGFDSEEFDPSGLQKKVLDPIREMLEQANGDTEQQITSLENMVGRGITPITEEVEGEVSTTGYSYNGQIYETEEEAKAARDADQMAYIEQQGYTITERADPNNEEATQYGVQQANGTIQWFNDQNEAMTNAYMSALTDDAVTKSLEKQLISGVWDKQFSVLQQHYLNEASNDAFTEINAKYGNQWENIAELLESGNQEAIDAFYAVFHGNIQQIGNELEGDVNIAWAQIKDTWVDTCNTLYANEQELAQKTYDLWIDTFNSIVSAREKIIKGEDWSGLSEQDRSNLYYDWLGEEGITPEEIMRRTFSTDKNRTQYAQFNPYYELGNTPDAMYGFSVDRGPDGFVSTVRTAEQGKAAQQAGLTSYVTDKLNDGGLVWDYNTAIGILNDPNYRQNAVEANADYQAWKELNPTKIWSDWLTSTDAGKEFGLDLDTNETMAATLASIDGTLIEAYDDDGDETTPDKYRLKEGATAELTATERDAVIAKTVEKMMSGWTDEGFLRYQSDQLAVDSTYLGEIRSLWQTDYEARIQEQQGYQEILNEAIAAGGVQEYLDSFEDPAERQAAWEELSEAYKQTTGQTLTTNTSLGDLSVASSNAATAVAQFSNALLWIMDKVTSGYTQFSTDDTGKVTASKTYGNIEQRDGKYYDGDTEVVLAEGQTGTYDAANKTLTVSITTDTIPGYINQGTTSTDDYEEGMSSVANKGQGATITNDQELIQSMASSIGMLSDEFENYTQTLYKNAETGKNWSDLTAEEKQEAREFAVQAGKVANAWKNLTTSQENNIKTLKKGQKSTTDYHKAASSLQKDLKTIFGDATQVTSQFVEDHIDDIEAMVKGDEKAAERVERALLDDMLGDLSNKQIEIDVNADGVGDQLTTIGDMLNTFGDEFSDKEIGFEVTADESPALQALNNIMAVSAAAGNDISENIQSALNAIGWEPELEYQVMNAEGKMVGTTSAKIRVGDSYETASGTMETMTEGMYLIPVIKGTKKTGGGASGMKKLASPSGGGGGGGGGEPKKLDKKKPEDEKERYHETNQSLERLADELEKIDKLKSRAYGKGHLDAIKQEISLLKQEIDLQQDYLKQAQAYLKIDKNRVASLGATFNADGTISNYDELIDSIVAKYNAFIDKYNAASASEQEDMEEEKEKMDEWFDEAMEWISQYEDTLNIIRDKENEILELQNEISAKTLEGIQYKVEFEVELNEEEVDFLDYLNEKYSEALEKQDKMVENLVKQQQLAQENLGYLNNAKAELDAKFASGELNQADYVTGLQDINDQILENLSTLEDLRKEIQEAYGNALEMASEAIDNHTEKMEHASQAMQSYISIMGLIGKGVDYDKLSDYYDKQYTYNLKSLETQQQYLEVLKEEESYYLAKMAAGDLTETERIQFEALQDTIAEVEDGILSKTEETLSALREAFSVAVEGILRDFEESVAGSGNTLEDLAADYEYYLEVQERHVSTSKELYEISKLNRQIEQDIADTSSSVYKQRLAALQEEIKAKSADRALTEYDIQMMNLEYELLQRQMALEEAKNAKDTVRLTRDSSGNYVYQYTADQDKITEAQQGVEDVLQQMAEANAERVTQLEQETINTYQNMVSQIEEIANSEVLTQEEKNAKIAEIVAQAQEKMLWLQDQYGIAIENTMATNALIQDHYNTDMITNAQISSEAMNETIAAIINKSAELSDGMAAMQEQIGQEMAELEYDINTVLNTTAWDDAGKKISTYDQVVDDATTEVDEMITSLSGENGLLDSIKNTTAAWDAQSAAIDALIGYYEDLYTAILNAQNAQSNTPNNPSTGSNPPSTDPGTNDNNPGDGDDPDDDEMTYPYGKASETSGNIKKGASGKKVKAIQYALNELGYGNSGTSGHDGKFGSKTQSAVKAFQKAQGITADGIVGDNTRAKFRALKYETGGLVDYTGPAWVDGTKENPELMLNATDTQNMLAAVQTVRALDSATLNMLDEFIKLATSSMLSTDNLHASGVASTDTELQQQVQITAEFPNVQDSNEIQDAFDNLINRAAQYIGSKK